MVSSDTIQQKKSLGYLVIARWEWKSISSLGFHGHLEEEGHLVPAGWSRQIQFPTRPVLTQPWLERARVPCTSPSLDSAAGGKPCYLRRDEVPTRWSPSWSPHQSLVRAEIWAPRSVFDGWGRWGVGQFWLWCLAGVVWLLPKSFALLDSFAGPLVSHTRLLLGLFLSMATGASGLLAS